MDPCPARNLMPNCHKRCYLPPQPQHDFALALNLFASRNVVYNDIPSLWPAVHPR